MSVFDIREVAAKTAKPTNIRDGIRDLLLSDYQIEIETEEKPMACYDVIESFLIPPGRTGSRSFDQSNSVNTLLRFDREQNGTLKTIMQTQGVRERMLWDHLYAVLRMIGFRMRHGRLDGLLEDKSKQNGGDTGQPDID